jgi:hypothetical protein
VHIPFIRLPASEEKIFEDFWGYHLIKDGVNYLIESSDASGEEIDIFNLIPIDANDLKKIADTKGNVYYKVCRPTPRRIRPEKTLSPREFIDNMTLLKHSNPNHQKILTFMALSQLWDRSYYRIATPPGFGKDSVVDIFGSFYGGCGTVESPTIAKLEDRASVLKWLVANEVVDIPKEAYDIIQNFLLPAAAHKNEITKRSRAFQNVAEIIDISKFSLSLFYNDILEYPDVKKYFDSVTKGAVKDRFPAFRFYGQYQEDFNSMKTVDVNAFVKENMEWYINMVRAFLYYKENYQQYLHKYNTEKLNKVSGRDAINLGRLLKIADFYSQSQEEFDSWIEEINKAMEDYVVMLQIPKVWEPFVKKITNGENDDYAQDQIEQYKKKLRKLNTSQEKIEQIKKWLNGDKIPEQVKDQRVWEFEKELL